MTDVGTSKATNLDPGGSRELEVAAGSDVPDQSLVVTEGSKVVLSGCLSVKVNAKTGVVVPK